MPRSRAGPRHAKREAVVVPAHLLRDDPGGAGRKQGEGAARRGRIECEGTEGHAMERRAPTARVELLVDDHDGRSAPSDTRHLRQPQARIAVAADPADVEDALERGVRERERVRVGDQQAHRATGVADEPAAAARQHPVAQVEPPELDVETAWQIALEQGQVGARPDPDLEDAEPAAVWGGPETPEGEPRHVAVAGGALGHPLQRRKERTRDRIVERGEPVVEHPHEAIGALDTALVDQARQTVAYRPVAPATPTAQGADVEIGAREPSFELERPAACGAREGADVRGRHRPGRSHSDVERSPQRLPFGWSKPAPHVLPPRRSSYALRGV